jgi:hypothetical protein
MRPARLWDPACMPGFCPLRPASNKKEKPHPKRMRLENPDMN